MNRDDAVLLLAHRSAVLALHSGRHETFFDIAGLIDDANAVWVGMLARYDPLQAPAHAILIPNVAGQKLLQRSRRHTESQSHGLDALLPQVRELPFHINGQMLSGVSARKTIIKLAQIVHEPGLQLANLLGIHARILLWATSEPKGSLISPVYAMSNTAL
jgi:hypothetical protein